MLILRFCQNNIMQRREQQYNQYLQAEWKVKDKQLYRINKHQNGKKDHILLIFHIFK